MGIGAALYTLGTAAAHLMSWCRPRGADAMGLHVCLHADTDQEYTDHRERLTWVGPPDPRGLDVAFFAARPPASMLLG